MKQIFQKPLLTLNKVAPLNMILMINVKKILRFMQTKQESLILRRNRIKEHFLQYPFVLTLYQKLLAKMWAKKNKTSLVIKRLLDLCKIVRFGHHQLEKSPFLKINSSRSVLTQRVHLEGLFLAIMLNKRRLNIIEDLIQIIGRKIPVLPAITIIVELVIIKQLKKSRPKFKKKQIENIIKS